jgi:hypothetical protein
MVLAEFTTEITSDGSDGVGKGAGINMKKRFFFDWVDVFGNQRSVNQCIKNAFLIFPYATNAPPVRFNSAAMRA